MPKSNGVAKDFDSAVMLSEVGEEILELCRYHQETLRGVKNLMRLRNGGKMKCCFADLEFLLTPGK